MKHQLEHQLEHQTGILHVTIPGDILSTNADGLRAELFGLLDSPDVKQAGLKTLKLDLSAAQMIDSMGLNLLVALIRSVKLRTAEIQATITSLNVQQTFLFTRLDKQMEIVLVQ